MKIDDELESVGRIITSIKMYRHQTKDDQDVFTNKSLDAYLKRYLVTNDYRFWQFLRADGHFFHSPVVNSTLDNLLSLEQFKQLLKRYKRAVYESSLATPSHFADL